MDDRSPLDDDCAGDPPCWMAEFADVLGLAPGAAPLPALDLTTRAGSGSPTAPDASGGDRTTRGTPCAGDAATASLADNVGGDDGERRIRDAR